MLGAWAQVQTPKARDPGHDPALSGSGVGQGDLVGKAAIVALEAP